MKSFILGLLVLGACFGAHRADPNSGDDVQGPVCGDVTCDEKPADTCADGDTLRTYDAACADGQCSYPSTDIECGSDGCCVDHCCTTAPSNASDFGALEDTGLVVAPPNGTFNTDTDCAASSALGSCTPVTRTDLPGACVCRADEITIGSLEVTGTRALVLLAKTRVVVQTSLDVTGEPGVDGPGAVYPRTSASSSSGGSGGSFGTRGNANASSPPATYGEPTLVPLLGGMGGKGGGNLGGGGGGALQITAGVRLEVLGTINAGGGGGKSGYASYSVSGGGGGGSGGGILLEAPTVIVTGRVIANGGGGGGGGGNGGAGSYGWGGGETSDPSYAAPGGPGNDGAGCPLYGYVSGGDGGYGAVGAQAAGYGQSSDYDSRCVGSASFVGGGGGGGGVGRIRINTTTGCQCGGTILPQATFGNVVKQ